MNAPTAAPESRSTPGPSTGAPEPSQAASEAPGALDGATEPPPEYAWPATPGEFAALWNQADDDRRAHMVERLVANGEAAVRGFTLNHDGELARLRDSAGEVARLREALEQVRALAEGWEGYAEKCAAEDPPWRPRMLWAVAASKVRTVLASVDAPAPDEADEGTLRIDVARAIWETSRADEGTISATGANHVAGAVLAVLREKGALR